VTSRREHGVALVFLDLTAGSERLQVVVRPAECDAACRGMLPLLTRPGSSVRVEGHPGRSKRGEPSLFASVLELVRVPPEPAAILWAARLVACGAASCEEAAAALRCTAEALASVAHACEEEAADEEGRGAQHEVRRLAAALGGARNARPRAQRFSAADLGTLGALAAAHLEWATQPEGALAPPECVPAHLDPERGLPVGLPAAEAGLRLQYLRRKKVPQLRWMLHQARRRRPRASSQRVRVCTETAPWHQ